MDGRPVSRSLAGLMERTNLAGLSGLVVILAFGFALRAGPVLVHDWPLQDGGLFYRLVGEIVEAGLRLPGTTSYDRSGIPFAYPPLALWLAAAAETVSGMTRAEVMRMLPVLFSVLELPAFFLLARDLLPGRRHAAIALLAFAAEPFAYQVQITGGGLTRSAGMLLSILAVWQGLRLLRSDRRTPILATAILGGLAALSHPEAAVFVVVALGLGYLVMARSRAALARLAGAALGATAVSTPWWLGVTISHGAAPLVAALTATNHDLVASLVTFFFAYPLEGPVPLLGFFALAGAVHSILNRRPYLVVWWAGICLFDVRYALVAGTVPISLLAAVGLVEVIVPTVVHLATPLHASAPAHWATATLLAAVALLGFQGAYHDAAWFGSSVALTLADRAAMAWVAGHTPGDEPFVVLGGPTWGSDDVAEWFPALADRRSLTTSQGLEWVPGGAHAREGQAETALRACEPRIADGCLTAWLATYAQPVGDWGLYVAANDSMASQPGTDCCLAVRAWIRANPGFRIVYDGPGALIAVPTGAAAAAWAP